MCKHQFNRMAQAYVQGSGNGGKVRFDANAIAQFNRVWPCSELRAERSYWFEFEANGDLVDCDVPEQDDGSAAQALSHDAQRLLFDNELPEWFIGAVNTGTMG